MVSTASAIIPLNHLPIPKSRHLTLLDFANTLFPFKPLRFGGFFSKQFHTNKRPADQYTDKCIAAPIGQP
jgi:hypothetical protein